MRLGEGGGACSRVSVAFESRLFASYFLSLFTIAFKKSPEEAEEWQRQRCRRGRCRCTLARRRCRCRHRRPSFAWLERRPRSLRTEKHRYLSSPSPSSSQRRRQRWLLLLLLFFLLLPPLPLLLLHFLLLLQLLGVAMSSQKDAGAVIITSGYSR